MFTDLNILAVVVASILAGAVGSIWYSPLLFGTQWMRAIGLTLEQGELPKPKMFIATVGGIIVYGLFFTILGMCIPLITKGYISFMQLGVSLTALLSVQLFNAVIWEKRPFVYLCIHLSYIALIVFGGLTVLLYWPW